MSAAAWRKIASASGIDPMPDPEYIQDADGQHLGQRTKTDGHRPALAVSPFLEESKEQCSLWSRNAAGQGHNKVRKPWSRQWRER